MTYMERITTKYGQKGREAMEEFIALGELDKFAKSDEDRATWEQWWQSFKVTPQGVEALYIVGREGV